MLMPCSWQAMVHFQVLCKHAGCSNWQVNLIILCRSPQLTYWQAARCVGDSLYTVPARDSSDLLKALRLGSSMGFFKPLTATGFGRAWYHRISTMPAPPMPMIGCHVTLEGPGIQWVCGQVPDPAYDASQRLSYLRRLLGNQAAVGLPVTLHGASAEAATICHLAVQTLRLQYLRHVSM